MPDIEERQAVERRKHAMVTGLLAIVMLLLFAFYANLRWANEAPAFDNAKETGDTPAYVRVSGEKLLSRDFWANTRPPMFPLVLKFYSANEIKVASFQTAFSVFAWGVLALSLSLSVKSLLRPIAFVLILALSLERHIAGWDVVMLTESLSVSLLALFLAAWLWLLRGWSWGKVIVLCMIAIPWAFTRDTNGWILLMVAGLILLGVLFFGGRKRYLAVAFVFATIFGFSNLSANTGHRWVFPFQNVLAQRILTDQRALDFFSNCGMPVTSELLDLAGGSALSKDRAFYTDPALESYRIWLYADGKSCYMRWLVSRPLTSLREPWVDFTWLLAFENVSFFYPKRYEPILPWYAERILYPQDMLLWLWGLTTFGALVAVWKKAWKSNAAWVVFIGLCLLIYPHIFIVWHGDVSGTHRHALTVSLQFVLGIWLFGFLSLESILTRFRVPGFV
ncbi:MAG: hypothetical protein WBL25_09435 [Anaerolineales bacterium]